MYNGRLNYFGSIYGTPLNCPKCKSWCISPLYHELKKNILKYECKECGFIFTKKDIYKNET